MERANPYRPEEIPAFCKHECFDYKLHLSLTVLQNIESLIFMCLSNYSPVVIKGHNKTKLH